MFSKLFWLFVYITLILGWELGFLSHIYLFPSKILADNVETIPTPTPEILIGVPQSLIIPSLNIHAAVESVGLVDGTRMDVPKSTLDVAWLNTGAKPGEKGNVVIDGHYDTNTGAAAVFYSLKDTHVGDIVQIIDDHNTLHVYVVTNIASFTNQNFPFAKVFGNSDTGQLFLITCDGTWNRAEQNYSRRAVVTAQLEK